MKKAFGLLRVSTIIQETESQRNQLIKVAENFGYEITEFFSEKITGYDEYDEDRESIIELRARIIKDKPQAVFILELSRLTRRSIKVSKYINELSLINKTPFYFHDHDIWTINEDGSSNDKGINTLYCSAKAVEDELKRIKERTARGREEKARHGFYIGHLKDGYKVSINEEGNKIIEIDEERAKIIKKIFELYTDKCLSISEIMNWLNAEKIPTTNKYRAEHKTLFKGYKNEYHRKRNENRDTLQKREDALWVGSCIANILRDRWYIGEREYKGIKHKIPRIISEEKWEETQRKLDENKTNVGKPAKNQYLLNNILYCGKCGKKLYAHTDEYNNMYYCSSQEFGKEARCGLRWIRQQNLDAIIHTILTYRTLNHYGEKIFLEFWKVDETKIKELKESIKTSEELIIINTNKIKELDKKLGRLIDEKVTTDDSSIRNKCEELIQETKNEVNRLTLENINYNNSVKLSKKELNSLKNFGQDINRIIQEREFYSIKNTVNNVINRIELYNPDKSITLIKIIYKHNKIDLALYAPRYLYKKFIFLSHLYDYDYFPIKYNPQNHHLTFEGKYLSFYHHQEMIFDDKSDYEFDESDYYINKGITIPYYHSDENKRKYQELAKWRFENQRTTKEEYDIEINSYDILLENGTIPISFEDYIKKLESQGQIIYKDSIPVVEYFKLKKRFNSCICEYEDLYPMSQKGLERKEYNRQYHRNKNKNKTASQIKYLVKDLNYEQILKERKALYNKKDKIKRKKRISEEEREESIKIIDAQLAVLKHKVKYLPEK